MKTVGGPKEPTKGQWEPNQENKKWERDCPPKNGKIRPRNPQSNCAENRGGGKARTRNPGDQGERRRKPRKGPL